MIIDTPFLLSQSARNAKRASSEMLGTPKRSNDKRIAKTPSTTPRPKPKTPLFSTPHRHQVEGVEGNTPSNRRKRIRSQLEEAGFNDTSESILHKVREHNIVSRKNALQPLNDNQLLPLTSVKVRFSTSPLLSEKKLFDTETQTVWSRGPWLLKVLTAQDRQHPEHEWFGAMKILMKGFLTMAQILAT